MSPIRPLHQCSWPACGKLTDQRYCPRHSAQHAERERSAKADYDRTRPSSTARGYSSRWAKAARGYLAKHPWCVAHEAKGEIVRATVVDHIRPHRGDRELFWDRSNWQGLCGPCHNSKTAREDGRWGKREPGSMVGAGVHEEGAHRASSAPGCEAVVSAGAGGSSSGST